MSANIVVTVVFACIGRRGSFRFGLHDDGRVCEDGPSQRATNETVRVARLQSPAPEAAGSSAMPPRRRRHSPTRGLPPAIPDQVASSFRSASGGCGVRCSPDGVGVPGRGWLDGARRLAVPARSELIFAIDWANRMRAAPLSDAGNMLNSAAAGRLPSGWSMPNPAG